MIRTARLLLLAVLPAAACRGAGEIESMLGTWSGTLACSAEIEDDDQTVTLEYATALVLDLTDQDEKSYEGTLEALQTYTWQGADVEQQTLYAVALFQPRAAGSQPVELQSAACTDYAVWVDGVARDEVFCTLDDAGEYDPDHPPDTAPPPPQGDLRWDGADTIDLTGSLCSGSISR